MTTTTLAQPAAAVVPPGHGGKFWIVGDQVTFKFTGEETGGAFTFAENYIPPQSGPPPHVHHREDECFYLLDGEMMFGRGDAAFVGGPGTAVFLPRGVPHVFKNVGDRPARFLLLVTPSGFERMVVAGGQAVPHIPFDKAVGPADVEKLLAVIPEYGLELCPDWKPTAAPPQPKPDRKLWVLGHLVTIKLTAADTAGTLSLVEVASPPGGPAVPPHSHRAMDEIFYVAEGEFEFTIAGETRRAPAGTTIHVPRGVPHTFRNAGATWAKLIDYHLPGGFERFFEDAGVEAANPSHPPQLPPPDRNRMIALLDRHGMDV
jgi:quercetin dioxygenase-like cupin family protein